MEITLRLLKGPLPNLTPMRPSVRLFMRTNSMAPRYFSSKKGSPSKVEAERVKLAYTKFDAPKEHQALPPLVIMHGLFGSRQNWKSLAKAFSRFRTVYTLDLRNHGESPHSPVHTYEAMGDDVIEFLREQKLEKVAILGHSMGGKVSMTVALKQTPEISQMIVVDMAPIDAGLSPSFSSYVQAMKRVEEARVSKQSMADEILRDYIPEISIRQFLLTNLKKDLGTGEYHFRIPLDILGNSLSELGSFPFLQAHHTFHGPALFIAGSRSDYIRSSMYPTIRTFFPEAVITDIDAGHWVHAEKPEEFMKTVVTFLNKHS
ncbi:uncharacterized protein VTP21DRAFT_7550 [Calcarisporiella thermophila]|uniref:uncharacterized protein n=1 Tax=Calcarisporiella thermophila TaxID=911321 RepID=UPI00374297B8